MHKAIRSTYWAFTVPANLLDRIHDHLPVHKNHPFDFNEKKWELSIGPVEHPDEHDNSGAYRRGYIRCLSTDVAKSASTSAVDFILFGVNLGECELSSSYFPSFEPVKNIQNDRNYIGKRDSKRSASVDIVEECIVEAKKKKGAATKENIIDEVVERAGPGFYSKNKVLINDLLGLRQVVASDLIVEEDLDEKSNMESAVKIMNEFIYRLQHNIKEHGIHTTHPWFNDWDQLAQLAYITIISLLPNLKERKRIPDLLPSLLFWGDAGTGKSFMFNESPAFKMVATDASGVGRFKLEASQTGFLLDDWTVKMFMSDTNISTIKKLATGGIAATKIWGDTVQNRAFIVCTMNELPYHLCQKPPKGCDPAYFKINSSALARRFISLRWSTTGRETDPLYCNWGHGTARYAMYRKIVKVFECIPDGHVRDMLSVYINACDPSVYGDFESMYKLCIE